MCQENSNMQVVFLGRNISNVRTYVFCVFNNCEIIFLIRDVWVGKDGILILLVTFVTYWEDPAYFKSPWSVLKNSIFIITVEFFSLFKPETEEELGWVTLRFGRYLLFFVTFVTYYWEDPANFKSDPWSI